MIVPAKYDSRLFSFAGVVYIEKVNLKMSFLTNEFAICKLISAHDRFVYYRV